MARQVFLVEDHAIFRQTLEALIDSLDDFEVCGMCATAEAALRLLPAVEADVVMVDVSLPGLDGIELVRALRRRGFDLPCVVMSGDDARDQAMRAWEAGARGYIVKGQADIEQVLRRALTQDQC